jgi:Zn-finger protein
MLIQVKLGTSEIVSLLLNLEKSNDSELLTPREAERYPCELDTKKTAMGYVNHYADHLQKTVVDYLSISDGRKLIEAVLLTMQSDPQKYAKYSGMIEQLNQAFENNLVFTEEGI